MTAVSCGYGRGEDMAQNVVIRGITYSNLPAVDMPKANGQGDARFHDISDATITNASQLRNGVKGYGADGTPYTGNMTEKAAATITPSTSDQIIQAGQYLAGAQTVKGDANLQAANIRANTTIFGVTGTLDPPVVTQDPSTHVLRIS